MRLNTSPLVLCFALLVVSHQLAAGETRDTSPLDNWWNYKGMYGEDIGGAYQKERLVVADIDGDGTVEILAGATLTNDLDPADFFFIASHRADTGDYPIDFLSPAILEGAETINAADVDGDGIWEIFLGHELRTGRPEIRVLEGDPPVSARTLDSSLNEVTTFRFAQPGGVSNLWLIASDLWGKTAIFDTESWTLLAEIPYGAIDLEIGDVTGNAEPEFVYSSGEVVVFDGTTASLLYDFDWGDATNVELIQLDGDPELEMISGGGGEPVRAWDFGDPTPLWELPQPADMIRVVDVTGDGDPELILTTYLVTCIDPETQTVMWTYEPTGVGSDGIGSFAAADVDADGTIEMILGTGVYSWDPDALFVVDAETQTEEWRTYERDRAYFQSAQIADLNDNGDLEIVFATLLGEGGTHPPPWEGGWIHVMDARTHEEIYHSQAILDPGWPTHLVMDLRIGDVDDDGETELVAATRRAGSTGHVLVYDGATMVKEAEYDFTFVAYLVTIELADVDNDGDTEIVGVTSSSHTEYDNRIWIMDGATGVVEWQSEELPGFGYTTVDIEVGNLDSDPALELIVISSISTIERVVSIVDGISHDTWVSASDAYASAVTMDLNGNGRSTVLLGMGTGELMALDDDGLGGFTQTFLHSAIDEPILAMEEYRIPGSGEPRIALTSGDGRLVGFDPATASVVWQSEPILKYAGGGDAIATAPIATETGTMFIIGGDHTVYQFGGVVEPSKPTLVSPTFTINEDDGFLTVTTTRQGGSVGEVSAAYATTNGTAVDGEDYTGVSGSLLWTDGDTSDRTVAIGILDDATVEGPEDFFFVLSDVIGGVLGSPAVAIITIEDDDSSTVRFTAATTSVNETAGTVSLTVSRSGDTSTTGSVAWATADGTAVAGEDYTSDSGTLDWAAGNGDDQIIEVSILDDALYEPNESFTVVLSSPGGNAFLGEPSTATVTISSEDVIEIIFSAASYSVGEGDGNATITAWRTGATNSAVTADYATTDGTATAGSDYTTATGTLSWADGDIAPKTFDVPLLDDGTGENDETVLLALSNPTGGAIIGTPGSATLTIEDNDGTALQFTAVSFYGDEGGASIVISVERVGGDTSGVANIDFATADGTAIAGLDYVATSGTLSWADGETVDKTFRVTILDDNLVEGPEDLTVSLSNPTGNATLGSPSSADVDISDDDGGEIPINTETNGPQTRPDAAMAADGRSVVVWESYLQDGSGWGIFGQRFDADGTTAGTEFRINSTTAGDQRFAAVAMAPGGAFTVVWRGSDASGEGIRGRRFDADGAALGANFIINTTTNGDQNEPDIAIDDSGAALVVWQSDHTGDLEVRGRSFDPAGSATGNEFAVNTTTTNDQQLPSVAGSSGGGFVAAWQSYGQDGPAQGIIARRFASGGSPLGAEVVVNEWTSGDQISPDVAQAADGSFLVAWEDTTHQDGMGSSIRARRFSSTATPLGGDFQLNTYWMDDQTKPMVASDGAGMITVAWESEDQDGSDLGIYSRTINGSGAFVSPEIRFNNYVAGIQHRPGVARSDSGAYWVVWASGGQDGSGDGIFGVFGAAPVIVNIFSDGFETGDTSLWSSSSP